jgi:phosphoribosylformylglycinamidine cyclo-ligase
LSKFYAENYKESYDTNLNENVVYIGKNELSDPIENENNQHLNIGKMLLSPTRTYAPIIIQLLENHFDKIHGMIHCSGGGQTKCMKYMAENIKIIKDNLFTPPPVFQLIQQNSGSNNKEMYEVFNMGCRLEIYCSPEHAEEIIAISTSFNVDAQIIGRVEADVKNSLEIHLPNEVIVY